MYEESNKDFRIRGKARTSGALGGIMSVGGENNGQIFVCPGTDE